ncbi:helix-loop-helix DNA-binding domain-containing protein [Halteromyces radiatus]|uniref:helix-loop-helix DNA-binding domain-containing protein n=1 Tax=Halteromyces radiatus TaxID=101107 RepID=UPI00221FA1CF|nr:helix-loop-helix DNA-binding domain-containing protein [Halteromyces radiatus]KAI8092559.1 helix-loop-helix DNA-binding domain-containing protein [Halteromyces radiatus]
MYSPTQQEFNLDSDSFQHAMTSQHTTVGAMPVRGSQQQQQQQRNSGVFNHQASYHHHPHQRQSSFGTAASIAMSPPRGIPFNTVDPTASNWFGTSLDSSSSFGQSPPTMFATGGGRNDLIVSPSNSTSHLDGFVGNEDDEVQQRNLQEMFEKRRRRRESHNAVERRRRDNINERIQELSTLLPEHLLESAPSSSNINTSNIQNGGKAINKGTILKLSVDHIKDLREEVARYKDRVQELERMIEAAKGGCTAGQQQYIKEEYHHQQPRTTSTTSSAINGIGGAAYMINQPPPPSTMKDDLHLFGSNSSTIPLNNTTSTTKPNNNNSSNNNASNEQHHSATRHERVGSLQFQQQFGNLHIASDDPTSQS